MLEKASQYLWYTKSKIGYFLIPLAFVYFIISKLRYFYHWLFFRNRKLSVPVVVVGNITVGGSGKTPLVISIAKNFISRGLNPAIVTCGYKGKSNFCFVKTNSLTKEVGDEALMLKQKLDIDVVVSKDRYFGCKKLLKDYSSIDVIITDDGLQNYSFPHDVEIAVFDSGRKFGNNLIFPAGPLRESTSKLSKVDFVVENISNPTINQPDGTYLKSLSHISIKNYFSMYYEKGKLYNLIDVSKTKDISYFSNKEVFAVSALGNNKRFFELVSSNNIKVHPNAFLDHYNYSIDDFKKLKSHPIITTEKDAVKIKELYLKKTYVFKGKILNDIWVLPISISLDNKFFELLYDTVRSKYDRRKIA